MILKYTIRLIKSTFNRFVAILAIVFIGVSFMMGLRSNYNIMKDSVERYVDNSNLYDIQIYSNFGFDINDADALKELDYIEDVYPSKTRDVFSKDNDGNVAVARILELDSNMNNIELEEGRFPENENECLIIRGYEFESVGIDSNVSLYLEEEELSESLKNLNFNVVGIAKSSEYMSKTFSTSNLKNNTLGYVLYVPNSNFIGEYYTCMYIKLFGSEELYSFSEEYENYVNEKSDLLKSFSNIQSQEFRNKIIDEAKAKIEEGRAELEANRAKYSKELNEAKKKVDDGKRQLDAAKAEIESGEREIPRNEQLLRDSQTQIDAGWKEIEENEKTLNDGIAQIQALGMSLEQLESTVNSLREGFQTAKNNCDSIQGEIDELDARKEQADDIVAASEYSNAIQVRQKMNTVDPNSEEYAKLQAEYDAFVFESLYLTQRTALRTRLGIAQAALDTANRTIYVTLGGRTLDDIADSLKLIRDGQAQIASGKEELKNAQIAVDNGWKELEEGKRKLASGRAQYESGLIEYNKGLAEYNSGLAKFNREMRDAEDQLEDAENQINDLQEVEWIILNRYDTNYSFFMYKNTCEQMKSIGTIIPLLFFVVAALVCSTTMTRLIDEQRSQIGIYRALGFTKFEVISIYLLYVIIASLSASIVAVFVGILLFPAIIYTTWRLMYNLPTIRLSIPLDNLTLCILCFTLLMMLVTFIVIYNSLKDSSAQLLRPKAPKATKQIILEKWTWLWEKLPFTSKVTARNLLRYKGRFIMTVLGVAGCTSLLLMGFGIKDSISSLLDLQYKGIFKYNYIIDLENDRHINEIIETISLDENNEAYSISAHYSTNVSLDSGSNKAINVIIINGLVQPNFYDLKDYRTNKNIYLSNESVILSEKFADINDINVGDSITFESIEGTKAQVIVGDITKNYIMDYMYISNDLYNYLFNEEIEYNKILVTNNKDVSQLYKLSIDYRDVNNVYDFTEDANQFVDMLEALDLIIVIIIVVAGALAFVVLINLTNVNISERIREIATLKVLGFREGEVDSYIFKEIMLMTIVGAIIGLPLGAIEERYVMSTIDMEMCIFPHIIKTTSCVYSLLITIIFAVIVLLLTRKTLRRVEMVESLKSIE